MQFLATVHTLSVLPHASAIGAQRCMQLTTLCLRARLFLRQSVHSGYKRMYDGTTPPFPFSRSLTRRAADEKKHNAEVDQLKRTNEQLKTTLEQMLSAPKK